MTHITADEARTLTFTLQTLVAGVTGLLDISAATEITFKMKARTGVLTKTKTGTDIAVTGPGTLTVALSRADTKSLQIGKQTPVLHIDWAGNIRRTFQFPDGFSIEPVAL